MVTGQDVEIVPFDLFFWFRISSPLGVKNDSSHVTKVTWADDSRWLKSNQCQ